MRNSWFRFACDATRLGFEAQWVMAARMMRIASGGARAEAEMSRMVSEKAAAAVEAQMAAAGAFFRSASHTGAARKALGVYRKRVRSNRRRLSRTR